MNFDQLFFETKETIKLEFLHSILLKNAGLRNRFIEFCKPARYADKVPGEQEQTVALISSECNKLKGELESLDFEKMDWRNYIPRHGGYIEDYEACEYFAEDQLSAVFEGLKEIIISFIKNGQLLNAVCKYLGAYDACLSVNIKGSDDIFEDITDTLLQIHKEITEGILSEINAAVKSDEQAILAIFEPLLISLTENRKTADHILEKQKTAGIDESWLPRLTVKLYSFKEGNKAWLNIER